jgi:NAD(P)-dependent dehydrogenase (short-subunit alcohol dehydrogenase family)
MLNLLNNTLNWLNLSHMKNSSKLEFQNMIAVVTGGGKGIGQAVALNLSERGARIAILDRDSDAGIRTRDDIISSGKQAIFVQTELSDSDSVAQAFASVVDEFGGINILSCNAGIQRYGDIESTTIEAWDEVMNVNLKSMFLCSKAAVKYLKKSKGTIVLMGSVQGYATQKNVLAYTTSKHAIIGFVRAMALDLAADGVRVNGVAPGTVNTPMLKNAVEQDSNPDKLWKTLDSMHPLGRIAQPKEIAEVVAFLAGEKASFITGSIILADGGLLLPISGSPAEGS